jgi:hypothetical protein
MILTIYILENERRQYLNIELSKNKLNIPMIVILHVKSINMKFLKFYIIFNKI